MVGSSLTSMIVFPWDTFLKVGISLKESDHNESEDVKKLYEKPSLSKTIVLL